MEIEIVGNGNHCSICGSPLTPEAPLGGTLKRKLDNPDGGATGTAGLSSSVADSFCTVFSLPTQNFIPILTTASTHYCANCFSQLQNIDSSLKQIRALQTKIEFDKQELECVLRKRIQEEDSVSGVSGSGGQFKTACDNGLLGMLITSLPQLRTTRKDQLDNARATSTLARNLGKDEAEQPKSKKLKLEQSPSSDGIPTAATAAAAERETAHLRRAIKLRPDKRLLALSRHHHPNEYQYKCHLCSNSYKYDYRLHQHLRTTHRMSRRNQPVVPRTFY